MKRTVEFTLGLIGSIIYLIIGFIFVVLALMGGALVESIFPGFDVLSGLALAVSIIVLLFAALGLWGALTVRRRSVRGGVLMLISGLTALVLAFFPWSLLWGGALIVGGIMACIPKAGEAV